MDYDESDDDEVMSQLDCFSEALVHDVTLAMGDVRRCSEQSRDPSQ